MPPHPRPVAVSCSVRGVTLHPMSRTTLVLAILAAALLGAAILRLLVSGSSATYFDIPAALSIFDLRATRLFSGIAVGAALGTAGVILQTLLRNPLASPDVIGVSAGAGLGVMLNLFLSQKAAIATTLATSVVWQFVPAAAGAGAVLALVVASAGWTLFRSPRAAMSAPAEPVTLLLTGVVISVLCSAGVSLLQSLMTDSGFGTSRLLIGSLDDNIAWVWAGTSAAVIAVAVFLFALLGGRTLDALSLPHDEAVSVGVNVARVRLVALVATGLLCAAAVVIAGPIGFIGLIAPHIARITLGPAHAGHRVLIVAAALAGATVIVGADVLVRVINVGGGRLPLGILTALLGGPTLIFLLRKESHGRA